MLSDDAVGVSTVWISCCCLACRITIQTSSLHLHNTVGIQSMESMISKNASIRKNVSGGDTNDDSNKKKKKHSTDNKTNKSCSDHPSKVRALCCASCRSGGGSFTCCSSFFFLSRLESLVLLSSY